MRTKKQQMSAAQKTEIELRGAISTMIEIASAPGNPKPMESLKVLRTMERARQAFERQASA